MDFDPGAGEPGAVAGVVTGGPPGGGTSLAS
jgi:hypothetical protein